MPAPSKSQSLAHNQDYPRAPKSRRFCIKTPTCKHNNLKWTRFERRGTHMRHFLIDTDTASDDAVALVMALRDPNVQIEAITVVAGNVSLDQGVQNALYTIELCQKQVPVYRGMSSPLLRPLETAQFVHGQDGMGDIGLPLSGRRATDGHAVDAIRETIHRYAHNITLVTLGPLTNI